MHEGKREGIPVPGNIRTIDRVVIILVAVLALLSVSGATALTQTYIGNVVPLSGYSYSGDTVYLFLTGPNLPPNGVALDNINRLADQGGATRVDVDADGHWTYKWYTGSTGGSLDAGAYTVWVTDRPSDRSRLSTTDYSTLSVSLSVPSLTAGTSGGSGQSGEPPQPGSIAFTSIPAGTSVVVDNVYKGMTPITVSGLTPGTHNFTLSHFGYAKVSQQVPVKAGSVSEVNATLVLLTGSVFVNTTPAGAEIMLDGLPAGVAPATLQNITQGSHLLNVTMKGFVTQSMPLLVTADQTTTVNVVLLPSTGHWPWLSGFLPSTAAAGLLVTLLAGRKWPGK